MGGMRTLAKKLHSLGYFVDDTGEFVKVVMADQTPVDMETLNSLQLRKYMKTHEHKSRLAKWEKNLKR